MNSLPSTRKEALITFSPMYFTGKPCNKGHISPRYTSKCSCIECVKIYNANNYAKPGAFVYFVEREFKNRYDITIGDYYEMLVLQGYKCAVCRNPFKNWKIDRDSGHRDAHIDHDHNSKKVKGLLCTNCNGAIEVFRKHKFNATHYLLR